MPLTRAQAAQKRSDVAEVVVKITQDLNYLSQVTDANCLESLKENIKQSFQALDDAKESEDTLRSQIDKLTAQLDESENKFRSEQAKARGLTELLQEHDETVTPQEASYLDTIKSLKEALAQARVSAYKTSTGVQTETSTVLKKKVNMEGINVFDTLPCFDGDSGSTVQEFLKDLDQAAQLAQWTDDQTRRICIYKLKGKARRAIEQAQLKEVLTLKSLKAELRSKFGPQCTAAELSHRFFTTTQLPTERVWEYRQRKEEAAEKFLRVFGVEKVNGIFPTKAAEQVTATFVLGLKAGIREFVEAADCTSLEDAVQKAEYKENLLQTDSQPYAVQGPAFTHLQREVASIKAKLEVESKQDPGLHFPVPLQCQATSFSRDQVLGSSMDEVVKALAALTEKVEKLSVPGSAQQGNSRECSYCRRKNHSSEKCYLRIKEEQNRSQRETQSRAGAQQNEDFQGGNHRKDFKGNRQFRKKESRNDFQGDRPQSPSYGSGSDGRRQRSPSPGQRFSDMAKSNLN